MKSSELDLRKVYSPVNTKGSHSFSPVRNSEVLKEIYNLQHEITKQKYEHNNYITGLNMRLNKEIKESFIVAEQERNQFEFEIKALEDELLTRKRIVAGEEERLMIRKGLHTKEIESLQHNLNQSISLVARAQDQMIWEINNRKRDSEIIKQDIQKNNDHRMTVMKDEFTEVHDELKHNISTLETEFLDLTNIINEATHMGEQGLCDLHSMRENRK